MQLDSPAYADGSVFALDPGMHRRAIVAAAFAVFALSACATPAAQSDGEDETSRVGTTEASAETRATLGVDQWHTREDHVDGMDLAVIHGEDAQGRTQAVVAVRWSSDGQTGERHVDVRVDDRAARLTETREGTFSWQGEVGIRESSRARTIAERVALDLGSRGAGVSGQNLQPLGGGLTGDPGDLTAKNPSWVDDVSACMKSLLEIFPDGYVGAHAICMGQHGP